MSAHGQLDLQGGEVVDDRIERAAKALYWADVRRRHYDAGDEKAEIAKQGWEVVAKYYVVAATTVLTAYGAL